MKCDVLIIGGGAAGLMAADAASSLGAHVMVVDAKPSLARKVLMAGKSGLNLSKDEPLERFLQHYSNDNIREIVRDFPPIAQRDWADELGAETFIGSSGKIFPKAMKASPLLRAWLAKLSDKNVVFRTHWKWVGATPEELIFDTPDGTMEVEAKTVIYALGGGSWARLGSTGEWVNKFLSEPLRAANVGVNVDWSKFMVPYYGAWLKNVSVRAGGKALFGEVGITRYGLEGGAIYALSDELADEGAFTMDLLPRIPLNNLQARRQAMGKTSLPNALRKLGLNDAARAMFFECSYDRKLEDVKELKVNVNGLRPINEAISTAGGVRFDALNFDLGLKAAPHIFVAGEMLDWSAPTGGYLLTGCFATGLKAGQSAAKRALAIE